MKQITDTILMIRPVSFRMNEQTAVNNYFMEDLDMKNSLINSRAKDEFDNFVHVLENAGVRVIVINDRPETDTPDSVFPNNWVSFHESGNVVVYPMFAENRRRERREDIFDTLEQEGFHIENVIDYTAAEKDNIFLEGTGSLVMDRVHQKVYCALSERAHESLLLEFCEDFKCQPVVFTANQTVDGNRLPIYHTNVMMCLAEDFVVICLDSIDDEDEKKEVVAQLEADGKEIIPITEAQMNSFAGNMLQLAAKDGSKYLVMSSAAYYSLSPDQLQALEAYNPILHSDIRTIEACGGGSARRMMAEIFLPYAD